ncbi:MAG: guanylate kinase [Bacteroidota bacterium]|nr:guanylate kinase [Bacteroidota bacterium]
MEGKAIIFSAPSGSGKTTIVKHLLEKFPQLDFSISACSRPKRPNEQHAKDYYFLSLEEFKNRIQNNEFVEWEEVYTDNYYGTLKSEIERIWGQGKHVIFDVDVKGGLNIKKYFGPKALSVFVKTPSLDMLEKRLRNRGTETEDKLRQRLEKARFEIGFVNSFDKVLHNIELEQVFSDAELLVNEFLNIK